MCRPNAYKKPLKQLILGLELALILRIRAAGPSITPADRKI